MGTNAILVLEQPLSDIPVFKVRREDGTGRIKTLHRNQLLPFTSMPRDETECPIVGSSIEGPRNRLKMLKLKNNLHLNKR